MRPTAYWHHAAYVMRRSGEGIALFVKKNVEKIALMGVYSTFFHAGAIYAV